MLQVVTFVTFCCLFCLWSGGQLLRHYKDGRTICIICWEIEKGEYIIYIGNASDNIWEEIGITII